MNTIQIPISIGVIDDDLETEATVLYKVCGGEVEILSIELSTGSDITDLYSQDKLMNLAQQIQEGEIYAI